MDSSHAVTAAATNGNDGARKVSGSQVVASFDSALLRTYIRKLLETTLSQAKFDKDDARRLGKEIISRVRDRMMEIAPEGWRFVVTSNIYENLGQGGRADMATHWGPDDVVIQEVYSNAHIQCICLAYAIRVVY